MLRRYLLALSVGDAWSLSKAQEEARRLQTLIDAGHDPRQVKAEKIAKAEKVKEQAKTEALRNSILVMDAWNEYVAKKSPRWSQHHIIDHAKVSAPGGEPKRSELKELMYCTRPPQRLVCSSPRPKQSGHIHLLARLVIDRGKA